MRSGSNIVLKTSSRGASRVLVISSSRSEGNVTLNLLSLAITAFLLVLDLVQDLVQSVEALLPEFAIALDPLVGRPQRRGIQAGRPPLGFASPLDELCALEHLQMLVDGGPNAHRWRRPVRRNRVVGRDRRAVR